MYTHPPSFDPCKLQSQLVVQASTGPEAIEQFRLHQPDVTLMDLQMPGMNGIEALGVLRANPATAAIPVIAVTASVMQQDRKQITEAGFDAYVGKPINLKEFLDAVRHALEGNRK